MKILTLLITISFTLTANAQNYLISFAGTGESTTLDSIEIENLITGASITLNGDNMLQLTVASGIADFELEKSSSINIYPNPTTEKSTLLITAPVAGDAIISVLDITGKIVTQIKTYIENYKQEFTLSGLQNGIYIINVKGISYQFSEKLISFGRANGITSLEKVSDNKGFNKKVSIMDGKEVLETVDMEYTIGDRLLFTGKSGNYSTIMTDIPESDKIITFNFIACTDVDNNNYPIVEIGNQVWMAENLKVTHYSDGTAIPLVTNNTSWGNLADNDFDDAYCYYDNDTNSIFGVLYTNAAALNGAGSSTTIPSGVQGVCPTGWHLPSPNEWWTLRGQLGLETAAGQLKSVGTLQDGRGVWYTPNTGATNSTGFSALPGGDRRDTNGTFRNMSYGGTWHTTYHYPANKVTIINITYLEEQIHAFYLPKSSGNSVRCVKD